MSKFFELPWPFHRVIPESIPQSLENTIEAALLGYGRARSMNYTAQFVLLNSLSSILPGSQSFRERHKDFNPQVLEQIQLELKKLLKEDARNIRKGVYPMSVLVPEQPLTHFLRLPKLMLDGLAVSRRKVAGKTTEFNKKTKKEVLDELPKYYRRNFHFQTDGYLSAHSANLYEHQVEMLFGGAADAMRRLIIPELRRKFGTSEGKGLRFLEIAAGTGRATHFVHAAFPKAKIVATDLSDPYLKEAQKKLAPYDRIDFMQADGTHLPFQAGHFDAVYSVFLYHELPLAARREIIAESKRVLKPGGIFGFVDSVQTGDKNSLDTILQNFPKQFHEPFYRDYIAHPMEELIKEAGFQDVQSRVGFVSKVCSAILEPHSP